MGLVKKLVGSLQPDGSEKTVGQLPSAALTELADGAIDTLGCVIQTMGAASFPLDRADDGAQFAQLCGDMARHVENGAAVPACEIEQADDGRRQWSHVRRFYVDRRQAEKKYVTDQLGDYRDVVADLIDGLRQIGQRDADTESAVRKSFDAIANAIADGLVPEIRATMKAAIDDVEQTFAQQKRIYEEQIYELNDRMSSLRQDLSTVREEMKRDTLTNAFNRGAFDQAVAQCLNLHFMTNQPVTLVLVDLDDFKAINDNFGHGAGDDVLKAVGETLERSFIRKSDFVARYGGDEFAVLLSDTSAQQSAPIISRFLENLGKIIVPGTDVEKPVSCSAGYTEIVTDDDVKSLLQRADMALYAAKAAGRNCARLAPPPDPQQ